MKAFRSLSALAATLLISFTCILFLFHSSDVQAADAAATFKTRCAGCHGPEGDASAPAPKSLGLKDLKSPDVQKKSDAELEQIIGKGTKNMPDYEKSLGADGVKDQLAYLRSLAKKK